MPGNRFAERIRIGGDYCGKKESAGKGTLLQRFYHDAPCKSSAVHVPFSHVLTYPSKSSLVQIHVKL